MDKINQGSEFTAGQRLVRLYDRLLSGVPLSPSAYAKEIGVRRGSIYYNLEMLSAAHIDVYNVSYGKWSLLRFYKN